MNYFLPKRAFLFLHPGDFRCSRWVEKALSKAGGKITESKEIPGMEKAESVHYILLKKGRNGNRDCGGFSGPSNIAFKPWMLLVANQDFVDTGVDSDNPNRF